MANSPLAHKKHAKYGDAYKAGRFWGLGIENETYLELGMTAVGPDFFSSRDRERYSVGYWSIYKSVPNLCPTKSDTMIPLLMNAHSLTKTDRYGNHQTTFETIPKPNPKYIGSTLLDNLESINPTVFRDGKEVWWTLDGDTIEFMTQNFYCATVSSVISEFTAHKNRWLSSFREAIRTLDTEDALQNEIHYPLKNHGFATFLTNRKNLAIFNNGTYHINLTLPTLLTEDRRIADWNLFVQQHRAVARMFQWLEPLLVARYCSGDILSTFDSTAYPRGSQRLCASRYVSVGTFDTDIMERGKVLVKPYTFVEGRWYEQIYEGSAYIKLKELGLDINFNKHWNHGLEFRIFDWFSEEWLPELLNLLVWMCDEALTRALDKPQSSALWNSVVAKAVWNGKEAMLTEEEGTLFCSVLGITTVNTVIPTSVLDMYETVRRTWEARWSDSKNTYTSCMALKERLIPELPALPPSPRNSVCSDFMTPIQMESVAITTHSPPAPVTLDTIRTVTLTVSTVPETPEKEKKDKKDKKDNSRKRWCCFC